MQLVEVFEQPDARGTVDRRDVKAYPGQIVFTEFEQFFLHIGTVEKGIFALVCGFIDAYARLLVIAVILPHFVFVQQLIYLFATLAAKRLFVPFN